MDFLVFERPDLTILSGHVEGKKLEGLKSGLQVEIKSASETSKVESVFPLPLSNFFQVKGLPKGKYLVQLRSSEPLGTIKFESSILEADLEENTQINVGPLKFKFEEYHHKQVSVTPCQIAFLFQSSRKRVLQCSVGGCIIWF